MLRFRWARWPFTATRALKLDQMQRHMLAIILNIRMFLDETAESFVRRRAAACSSVQKQMGYWSCFWAKAVVGWSDHLGRSRNCRTWAAKVALVRSPEELVERRFSFGRPCTRICSGFIKRRWSESVSYARCFLVEKGILSPDGLSVNRVSRL